VSAASAFKLHGSDGSFRHEAFFYAGQEEFLSGTTSFIRDGVAAGEPTLVVVDAAKIALLRSELRKDADQVMFADMSEIGSNPARIIPAWQDFVEDRGGAGRALRGIGEPIDTGRDPAALVECQRHESLLNLAFADTPAFWLLCPYDTAALGHAVIEEAERSHPCVMEKDGHRESSRYSGLEAVTAPFGVPLAEPPATTDVFAFQPSSLAAMRRFTSLRAADAGISIARTTDLLLAVNEVATNSIRHGGGDGVLLIWEEGDTLICEVRDHGRDARPLAARPLAGRERPGLGQMGGYGLWLANQLCDLVQLRSFPGGSVVRLHMHRG
jgi:anti-sigma regulatory factor (Ser/Thr protein kinase)